MKYFFVFLIFSITLPICGQIRSIEFSGLSKTKESYLHQFVTTSEGDPLDSVKLDADCQRLANLPLLANAQFQVDTLKQNVVFHCEELKSLLPIFSFGSIKGSFWTQVGISETNLGGRGNKLVGYYQYYDRSSFSAYAVFDRIKQTNWGININLVKWATLEPLFFDNLQVEYEYENYTAGAGLIRHFNFTDKLELGAAYFTERYELFTEGNFIDIPISVFKNKALVKANVQHNRVNYFFYFQDGWHNQLNVQYVETLGEKDPSFFIFFNDLKWFARIGDQGNFASRMRFGLSSNQVSPFSPFVLDSYLNIRGVGNRVDRGTGAIILNLEYRQTLIDRQKLAAQGVLFSDTGTWRKPAGTLGDFTQSKNMVSFTGVGLRLIHKHIFNAIFRMDYGINVGNSNKSGLVLGIGQYF